MNCLRMRNNKQIALSFWIALRWAELSWAELSDSLACEWRVQDTDINV